MSKHLTAENAYIFRITHRDNVPWIAANGIHSRNSDKFDPRFVNIGNPDLIDKRSTRIVLIPPGGTLSDYVPFYFTPFSPMLLNIKTGYNGIKKRSMSEIVILASSLRTLQGIGKRFVFTDRHAYLATAQFSSDLSDLSNVDWTILQNRDFKRDNDDLGKMERYQAEALVHSHLELKDLSGILCYDDGTRSQIDETLAAHGASLRATTAPNWYL